MQLSCFKCNPVITYCSFVGVLRPNINSSLLISLVRGDFLSAALGDLSRVPDNDFGSDVENGLLDLCFLSAASSSTGDFLSELNKLSLGDARLPPYLSYLSSTGDILVEVEGNMPSLGDARLLP